MSAWNYDYQLPANLIAQIPASPRDSSRLLVINRHTGLTSDHVFKDLPKLLRPSDVLVFNDTAVFPARLHGLKSTGGKVEVLLLRNIKKDLWEVISHPGIKPGQILYFTSKVTAQVIDRNQIRFSHLKSVAQIGTTPLPPYIHSSSPENLLRRQYQTVYAQSSGSAAAPTAGLHFTHRLLKRLTQTGIQMEYLTLHVGLGTFRPPTADQIASGKLHSEWFTLSEATAKRLNEAKSAGRRIIAVGTTTTRVLETCTDTKDRLRPRSGQTDIFIKPPYKFRFVDGLITNFHLPKSSLLMLVSAFSSPETIKGAYEEAVHKHYRFFSFGDASLIS